jgi:hypothetical protein
MPGHPPPVIARSVSSEAIQSSFLGCLAGLLRFARNDDGTEHCKQAWTPAAGAGGIATDMIDAT